MPEPITITLIALAIKTFVVAGALSIAVVAIITFKSIRQWFINRKKKISQKDKNNLAFTLKEKIAEGDFVVYKGIFDADENEIDEIEAERSKQIDAKLEQIHADKMIVIYE